MDLEAARNACELPHSRTVIAGRLVRRHADDLTPCGPSLGPHDLLLEDRRDEHRERVRPREQDRAVIAQRLRDHAIACNE